MPELIEGLYVQRDDRVPGGTKYNALLSMIDLRTENAFSYAGTVMGQGALALSLACQKLGKTAHIYVSARHQDSPALDTLRDAGAFLHVFQGKTVNSLCETACADGYGQVLSPGFDMPEFHEAVRRILSGAVPDDFQTIWTSTVSGTLTRSLQSVFRKSSFKTVKVVRAPCDTGRAEVLHAPEKYHQPARMPPPYPSCPYTDAKVWQFASISPSKDVLVWNTAG